MNPTAPAPTPAPIHDIVGPVWFWPYPLWMTVAAGLLLLAILVALGVLVKKLLTAPKHLPTNREKALAALDAMRSGVASADPYAFGVAVSDALRRYIAAEHGFRATTQTSLEFLNSIRSKPVFTDHEKEGLGVVLEKADLLKFARAGASGAELLDLIEIAARIVRGEPQSNQSGGRSA